MKWLAMFAFLLFSITGFTQYKTVSFSVIDSRAADIDAPSPDSLSHLLTTPYTTELEKVRSIFSWITQHISYNVARYLTRFPTPHDDGINAAIAQDTSLTLNQEVAKIVLKRRASFCDGYSRLFTTLCDYAGIKSEVITGYGKTNMNSGQFHCNHKWNAVRIDSNWYLLDATWASGYISLAGNSFIRDYNDNYFLTPPKYFIQDHYPEDIRWALLNNPPTLAEFNRSPFKQSSFDFRILSYSPSKGIINASVGDTITISLQTSDDKKKLCLIDEPCADSLLVTAPGCILSPKKKCIVNGNKVSSVYIVTSENTQWLQVMYNGDAVLLYKLNIRKQPFQFAPVHIKDIVAGN